MTWDNLAWEETLPSGTDIELQVAFSDDEEGPWNFVGPDGTSGTKFTTSTGQSVYGSPSSRYCRYKAYLTGDGTDTPTLGTVELGFSGNLDSQIRTFAFDDAGNMTEKITKSDSSLIEETRTYNDLNQITQNQTDDGTTVTTWTFTHDSNGNMTSKSDGTDTYIYVWNEDNQLESVQLNSSPVVDYVYDSGSRMLQRTDSSTTTDFHWDGWDLIREEKDDGVDVEVTNYLVPHGEILAFERDDEWFYLHGDGLSSTQLVTDDTGAQAARIVYGAWGEQLSVPGGLDVRFVGGLGVRNDSASGLIYMRHRWYDCELGRFISRDPIGLAGGGNLYVYSGNQPVSQVDPAGLDPIEMCGCGVKNAQEKTWTSMDLFWLRRAIDKISKVDSVMGKSLRAMLDKGEILPAEPEVTAFAEGFTPGDTIYLDPKSVDVGTKVLWDGKSPDLGNNLDHLVSLMVHEYGHIGQVNKNAAIADYVNSLFFYERPLEFAAYRQQYVFLLKYKKVFPHSSWIDEEIAETKARYDNLFRTGNISGKKRNPLQLPYQPVFCK